jgi:hypothetical protein
MKKMITAAAVAIASVTRKCSETARNFSRQAIISPDFLHSDKQRARIIAGSQTAVPARTSQVAQAAGRGILHAQPGIRALASAAGTAVFPRCP